MASGPEVKIDESRYRNDISCFKTICICKTDGSPNLELNK